MQFITLKPWAQAVGLVSLLLGLFWLAFSSINVAFKDQLLALRERGMYDARLEYEDRIAGLRKEIDKLNDRLLIDQGEYLNKVDQVRVDYKKLIDRHRRLVDFFHQGAAGRSERGQDQKIYDDPLPDEPGEGVPADANDSLGLSHRQKRTTSTTRGLQSNTARSSAQPRRANALCKILSRHVLAV